MSMNTNPGSGGDRVDRPHDRRDLPHEPDAGPGWISRAEARDLLGVGEIEFREILRRLSLSRRTVGLFLKSEIEALVSLVERLR